MMLIKVKLILIFSLFSILKIHCSQIATIDSFPDTEKLNYDNHRKNWVQHNVKLDSIPLNRSSIGSGRVLSTSSKERPFICYDFETCDVISTRVSRSKRYEKKLGKGGQKGHLKHQKNFTFYEEHMNTCYRFLLKVFGWM